MLVAARRARRQAYLWIKMLNYRLRSGPKFVGHSPGRSPWARLGHAIGWEAAAIEIPGVSRSLERRVGPAEFPSRCHPERGRQSLRRQPASFAGPAPD